MTGGPLRTVVYNAAERRARAPVRLVGHTVLVVVALVATAGVAVAALRAAGRTPRDAVDPLASAGSTVALAVEVGVVATAVVAATLVATAALDRRQFADLGLALDRAWGWDLAAGLALGAALQTGVLVTSMAAGWTVVVGVGGPGVAGTLAVGAALMLVVGSYEELWFRGYYLTNVAEGLCALPRVDARRAAVLAAALTAVGFGGVHAANPAASPVSTALVAGYGAYLAVGYLLTGELGLSVGFHVAWNYVQAYVYGFPVSGIDPEASLLATETAGPPALTGGAFGPEAGLVGAAWVLASLPALWWWVRRTRGDAAVRESVARPRLRGEP